jgi:hypothetical protein
VSLLLKSTSSKRNQSQEFLGPQTLTVTKPESSSFWLRDVAHAPEEAAKIERELTTAGWKYEIEGIFVGDPPQVGKYLSELRGYPFNFAIGLDMDGKIARQYGVKMFPSAIIEVAGKRTVVTRASEVEDKLK